MAPGRFYVLLFCCSACDALILQKSDEQVGVSKSDAMPCQCKPEDSSWKRSARKEGKCIFIDLGAMNGNTYRYFLRNGYGNLSSCPGGAHESWLVEANSRFTKKLNSHDVHTSGLETELAHNLFRPRQRVHALTATAAYMCESTISFNIEETENEDQADGSSMSIDHMKGGQHMETVPTANIMRMLYENTIPEDRVILKMDIEGAEWDIIPCLARSGAASLIDQLFVEVHNSSWSLGGTTESEFKSAMDTLRQKGVHAPANYWSPTSA